MTKPLDESTDLSLESCRSLPVLDIMFLEEGFIFAEFRNNSDNAIEIIKVRAQFETEPRLDPYETSVSPKITLMAHNRSQTIRIPFVADLSLVSTTNSYSLIVSYRKIGSQQLLTRTYSPFGSLVIHPIPRQEGKHFFVSHKDPENTVLARRVDHYLKKIGFHGYLAEDNRLPGVDLWQKNTTCD